MTNWHLAAEPAPALLVLPPAAASLDEAHAAIELWQHYTGKTLDGTQRLVVEVMMAETSDGKWAAQTTGREMPRQNGKGDEVEVVELWGLVQRGEAILHTVHDAVMLATQAQQRMLAVLDHPDLRRKVKKKWLGTGQQMIEMRNGGTIWYRTRTGGGGRGVDDIDRLVVDEAQHATEEHLAAVAPTLLANANPQMNALGTAALFGKSDWWWRIRRRALSESPGAFGYIGHTAERVRLDGDRVVQDPVDVHDRSLWPGANPAAFSGRGGGMDFLEEQLLRLGEESFAREHLGVWDPESTAAREPKMPPSAWQASARADIPPLRPGEMTLAYDVDLDGGSASIAIAIGTAGRPYVELVDHHPKTGWVPERLVKLVRDWSPRAVGCNGAGPAGSLLPSVMEAFRAADLDVSLLHPMSMGDYKAACGAFLAGIVEGRFTHRAGQTDLDAAVADATERPLGDAWAWDRRLATVPISPLVAVSIAPALLPTEATKPAPVFAY